MSIVSLFWIIPLPKRLTDCDSRMLYYRGGIPAHLTLSCDDKWRIPWSPDETDERYLKALVRFEDKRFWWHPGIDPLALVRAFSQNLRAGQVVSGGSTITMQVVRVLEPRPRTLTSKIVEAWRAIQLELRFSKREILGLYLRYAPFGRNLEGIAAASLAYFGHLPRALSFEETAVLLSIPQDPSRRFPDPANQTRLESAVKKLLGRLAEWRIFPESSVVAKIEKIPNGMRPFPRDIPHAARGILERYPNRVRIETTLDPGMQTLAEKLMQNRRSDFSLRQIHNGTVLILETESGEVRAAVGNFDFWDKEESGQIAGFWVKRSPGSALKPVLHAMGLDRRIFTPASLVPDVPVTYAGFSPKNFDGKFSGLVSMEHALAHSLNIPFVNLLRKIGVEEFLTVLQRMDVAGLDSQPGRYGLSAIIGGIELTAEELGGIYATIARGGDYRPVRWVQSVVEKGTQTPIRIFEPGTAWLTAQTLALRDRPDFPNRSTITDLTGAVHWKTGTSFGQRDAWAVGFGKKHTAAVWFGNFDNTASSALVGSQVAAPLLFDLLEAVDGREPAASRKKRPEGVGEIEVCAFSGMPPSKACEQRRLILSLDERIPATRCPYHVHVDIDLKTNLALTPMCSVGRRVETKSFIRLPTEVRRWLSDTSQNLPEPPRLAPFCAKPQSPARAKILSPADGEVILLIAGMDPNDQKVPLEAALPAEADEISWFINGKFLGSTADHERLWWAPEVGDHELAASLESGFVSKRKFKVRMH